MPPKLYKGEVKFTYYFLCEEGEEERVSEIVQQDVISNERHTTILESDVVEVDDLLEQVTVYSLNDEVRTSPLGLFLAPAEALLEYEVVEGVGATSDAYAVHAAGDDAATSEEIASIKTFVLFPNRDNQYVTRADLRFEDGWPATLDIAVAGGGSMRFLFVGHSELTTIDPDWFLAPPVGALEVIDHRSPTASDAANE